LLAAAIPALFKRLAPQSVARHSTMMNCLVLKNGGLHIAAIDEDWWNIKP
jgi:hypothetical protein